MRTPARQKQRSMPALSLQGTARDSCQAMLWVRWQGLRDPFNFYQQGRVDPRPSRQAEVLETREQSGALMASAAVPEALGCRAAAEPSACQIRLIALEAPHLASNGQHSHLDMFSAEGQIISKKNSNSLHLLRASTYLTGLPAHLHGTANTFARIPPGGKQCLHSRMA